MNAIKTTMLGGILFLVPFVFIVMILEKAFSLAHKIAVPIKAIFPGGYFFGINLIIVAVILGICFLAGMLARKSAIAKRVGQLDKVFTTSLPGYMQIKSALGGRFGSHDGDETEMQPVLVRDKTGGARLGFAVERDPNGLVVVFFPGVPNPQSGSASVVPAEQVEDLDMPAYKATDILQFYGRGLAKIAGETSGKPKA